MKKSVLIMICLILFIVSIAAVSAAEINQTDDSNDMGALSLSSGDNALGGVDNGTFTDLQKKINDANESSTIVLENDYAYDSSFSKNGITINKNLTIEGNGHVIDALGQSRIFYINSSSVTLNNITFKNGYTQWGSGGAIYFTSNVFGCSVSGEFINNTAGMYGGALFFVNIVSNCNVSGRFINNTANSYDGAICFWRSVSGCSVSGEFINNSASNDGGAICFRSSVSGCSVYGKFINNRASLSTTKGGGAICFRSSVSDCTISGEFINNSAYMGGAIGFYSGVSGCSVSGEFINNFAYNGGAILFENYYDSGVSGCSVSGEFINNSAYSGGAICFRSSVFGCSVSGEFINNNASLSTGVGGAICFGSSVFGCSVYGMFINNSAYKGGGAIYFYSVSGCNVSGMFINNSATKYGGDAIYFENSVSNFTIINSVILDSINEPRNILSINSWFGNNAFNYKNKLYFDSGSWLFLDASSSPVVDGKSTVVFSLNNLYNSSSNVISHPDISVLPDVVFELSAVNGYLDKYYVSSGESVIFTSTSNERGIVKATLGNASYYIIIGNGTFTDLQKIIDNAKEGSTIKLGNNYKYDSGFSADGIFINKNLTIEGNGHVIDALGQSRIFYITAPTLTLNSIIFKNGYTDDYGGAICFSCDVYNSCVLADFINNTADCGGAIYVRGNISDSLFIGDYSFNSVSGSGGAIYADNIFDSTFNGDFTGNAACDKGGVIYGNVSGSTFNGDFMANEALTGGVIYGNVSSSVFNSYFKRTNGGVIYGNVSGCIFNGDFVENNADNGTSTEDDLLGFAPTFSGALPFVGGVVNGNVNNAAFNSNFVANTATIGAVIAGNVDKSVFTGKFSGNAADYGIIVSGNTIKSVFSGDGEDIIDFGRSVSGDWLDSYIKGRYLNKNEIERLENFSKYFVDIEADLNIYVNETSTMSLDEVAVTWNLSVLDLIMDKTIKFKLSELKKDINPLDGPLGIIFDNLLGDFLGDVREAVLGDNFTGYLTFEIKTLNNLKDATQIANAFGILLQNKYFRVTKKFTLKDISVKIAPGVYRGANNKALKITTGYMLMKDGEGDVIIDAENKGYIFNVTWPKVTIDGLTFMHASDSAIIFENGMSKCVINANFIDNHNDFNGGAIYCKGDIKDTVFDGNYSFNSAGMLETGLYYRQGGVIYSENIINSIFKGNFISNSINRDINVYAAARGGVIYAKSIKYSNFTGKFIDNSVWAAPDKVLDVPSGGVICSNNILNCYFSGIFMDNRAYGHGGVIYALYNIEGSIFNGDFINNAADVFYGGVICCHYGHITNSIFSGNFMNNHAGEEGGVIYSCNYISNSIFKGNYNGNTAKEGNVIYAGGFYDDSENDYYYHNTYNVPRSDIFDTHYDSGIVNRFNAFKSLADIFDTYYDSGTQIVVGYGTHSSDIYDSYYGSYKRGIENKYSGSMDDLLGTSLNDVYVDGAALSGGDGSISNPFNNLNSALAQVDNNDTIFIAPGTYTGVNNVGLLISKSVNLVNWGDGDVIFDAENSGRIFTITVKSINITGLTFTRASDSALVFTKGLDGSRIEANFYNNRKSEGGGGAIYIQGYLSESVFTGDYVNNGANTYGGALYANSIISCVFDCSFINNTADEDGGAISASIVDCVFNSDFINNSALGDGGAIDGNILKSSFTGDFTNNNAVNGGVVYGSVSSSNFTSNFNDNGASNGSVVCGSVSSSNFNCDFVNNSAGENGGVICGGVSSSNFTGNFINNTAVNGGVVYSKGDVSKSLFRGVFTNNTSKSGFGGVVYVTGSISSSTFMGEVFVSNSTDLDSVVYSARGIIVDCTFTDNSLFKITAPNVVKYYGGSEVFTATLTDLDDNPVSGAIVTIKINDNVISRTTNSKGQVYVDLNQPSGNYMVVTSYDTLNVRSNVVIKPTIAGSDVSGGYGNVQYVVSLLDSSGKPLTSGTVTFNIDSRNYYSGISGGKSILNVGLNHGSYVVYATNPVTSEVISNNIAIKSVPTNTTLSGVDNISVGDSLTVTANVNASSGFVTFNIGSEYVNVTLSNNMASYTIKNLKNGPYTVTASYFDVNGNYLPSNASQSFKVSKVIPALIVDVDDIGKGQDAFFEIFLNNDSTGKVSLILNGKTYNTTLNKGKTFISISDLFIGTYPYTVLYYGDDKYENVSVGGAINVVEINTILNAFDLVKYYGAPDRLSAQLLDKDYAPLVGEKIIFTINGNDYERITDDSGFASMNINLGSGNYVAGVRFEGNGTFDAIKTKVLIRIKSTIVSSDITKIFRNETQYYALFLDTKGNPLINTDVRFNINGVFYTRTTNASGVARMNINLNPGEYIITATNPVNNEEAGNLVTVLSSIVENYDLVKYYRNASQYSVKLLDSKGNPVGANVSVEFNINGVFYTRYTNVSGVAHMNINLNPGEYIITARYGDCVASNIIKVLPTLIASDLTKKFGTSNPFVATLVDGEGKPLADKTVSFNINGVFYNRVTNATGQAKLNINLVQGVYIITSIYDDAVVSNKVTVTT